MELPPLGNWPFDEHFIYHAPKISIFSKRVNYLQAWTYSRSNVVHRNNLISYTRWRLTLKSVSWQCNGRLRVKRWQPRDLVCWHTPVVISASKIIQKQHLNNTPTCFCVWLYVDQKRNREVTCWGIFFSLSILKQQAFLLYYKRKQS